MRNVALSARSRDTSASNSLTDRRVPAPADFTSRGKRTQFANVLAEIPSLRAAPANPRLSTSDTACDLYSAV